MTALNAKAPGRAATRTGRSDNQNTTRIAKNDVTTIPPKPSEAEVLADHVAKALAAAPPLTPEQRGQIARILGGGRHV